MPDCLRSSAALSVQSRDAKAQPVGCSLILETPRFQRTQRFPPGSFQLLFRAPPRASPHAALGPPFTSPGILFRAASRSCSLKRGEATRGRYVIANRESVRTQIPRRTGGSCDRSPLPRSRPLSGSAPPHPSRWRPGTAAARRPAASAPLSHLPRGSVLPLPPALRRGAPRPAPRDGIPRSSPIAARRSRPPGRKAAAFFRPRARSRHPRRLVTTKNWEPTLCCGTRLRAASVSTATRHTAGTRPVLLKGAAPC